MLEKIESPDYRYVKEQQTLFRTLSRFFGTNHTQFCELLPKLKACRACIAGGAITSCFSNQPINDLDFYLQSSADKGLFVKLALSYGFVETFTSATACTFKRKSTRSSRIYAIQLITAFTGTPESVFDTFDFTICCGAFNFYNDIFELHPRFLPDIAKRRLVYLGGSRFPLCALYRVLKYQKRGYTLPGSTMMHLALSCSELNIDTYAKLKEQLRGVDTMYLQDFLETKAADMPFNYLEFIEEAFASLDGGFSVAEEQEEAEAK